MKRPSNVKPIKNTQTGTERSDEKYIGVHVGLVKGLSSGFLLDVEKNVKVIIEHGGRIYVGAQVVWQHCNGWTGLGDESESFTDWFETLSLEPEDVLNPKDLDMQAHMAIRVDIAPICWDAVIDDQGNTLIDLLKIADQRISKAFVQGEKRYSAAIEQGLQPEQSWEDLAQDEHGRPYDPNTMGTGILKLENPIRANRRAS